MVLLLDDDAGGWESWPFPGGETLERAEALARLIRRKVSGSVRVDVKLR
jgi:hypothetical protein